MGRINEILVARSEITDAEVAPDLKTATTLRGEIEFRHLDFSYNGVPVLKDVNLTDTGRQQSGDCRPNRLRQDHAGKPVAAHL